MAILLKGEGLELILSMYDPLPFREVYEIGQKQELRGNPGIAFKVYQYALDRFQQGRIDPAFPAYQPVFFDRWMASSMAASMGKFMMQKQDLDQASVYLSRAFDLTRDPKTKAPLFDNPEARYWTAELYFQRGDLRSARAFFEDLADYSVDVELARGARARITDIERLVAEARTAHPLKRVA